MKIIAVMLILIFLAAGFKLGRHMVANIDGIGVSSLDSANDSPREEMDKKE